MTDHIIKKILSEINFDDIETKTQLENNETNFSDKEITEFQKHSLDKIKIMLSEKYLSGDQSSLSLENNEGGENNSDTNEDHEQSNKSFESDSSDESNDESDQSDESEIKSMTKEQSDQSDESDSSDESNDESDQSDESDSKDESDSSEQSDPDFSYQSEQLQNNMSDDQFENKLRQIAKQMLKTSYNILEDEREESNTAKHQKGSEIRFNSKNKEIGLLQYKIVDDINDPVKAIHAVRQFRSDLVKQTKYKKCEKYIIDVRLKDREGGLVLIYQFWNEHLKPYLKDLENNLTWKNSLKNLTDVKKNLEGVILNQTWDQFDEDDEYYSRSIIETISAITNKEIKLNLQKNNREDKNSAYVYWDKDQKCFKIVIDPNDKLVNYKTMIEHEYGHILWETSFDQFFDLMEKWIDDLINEVRKTRSKNK